MNLTTCLAFAATSFLFSAGAMAAALEFSPTRIEFGPGRSTATIQVSNRGPAVAIQARAFAWMQRGDVDQLSPTSDLVLSPPIFSVPAAGEQVIRVVYRTGTSPQYSYRLVFDEVPPPGAAKTQLTMALRVSMPAFVLRSTTAAAMLEWKGERRGGDLSLIVENHGGSAVRFQQISVALPDGRTASAKPTAQNAYVLPNAQRRWLVPNSGMIAAGTRLRISVTADTGKSEETVTLP